MVKVMLNDHSSDFIDAVAIVSGGTGGIGSEVARKLGQLGASVVLVSQGSMDRATKIAEEVGAACRGRVIAEVANSCNTAEVEALYRRVYGQFGRLDILVDCAGLMVNTPIGMMSRDVAMNLLEVNVFGLLAHVQSAAKLMRKSGGGSIVTMSSLAGVKGSSGQVVYSATKSAVVGITKSAAIELAPYKIRVNGVAPGVIDTSLTSSLPRDEIASRTPLGRIGRPSEVADAAVFLASERSAFITGQILGVDGGLSL